MTEFRRKHDNLADTLQNIQYVAVSLLAHGCTALSCLARDARFIYRLLPAKQTSAELQQLDVSDVAEIEAWNLVRLNSTLTEDKKMHMTIYGLHKDEDDKLSLTVTQHTYDRGNQDLEALSEAINENTRLQHQVGLGLPELIDFADLDNAVRDYVHQSRVYNLMRKLETCWPHYSRQEIININ